MSFGTSETFKSKTALANAVKERGAENVIIFDTAITGGRGTVTVKDLAGTHEVICGPNVYTERKWYANVGVKRDGTIFIK